MDIKPGQKYKIFYGKESINNKLIHILAIFDAEYIAFKYYKYGKWIYSIEHIYWFHLNIKEGIMSEGDK